MSPGCAGFHPRSSRVSALDAGLSTPRKPAIHREVLGCAHRGDGDDGDVEMPPNDAGNIPDRHPLVRDRM